MSDIDDLESIADDNRYMSSTSSSRKRSRAGKAYLARSQQNAQSLSARIKRAQRLHLSQQAKREGK